LVTIPCAISIDIGITLFDFAVTVVVVLVVAFIDAYKLLL